ncbi:MAG: hypothetical protein EBX36_05555 [Planctomycetia bacterium]|nr:hypothetical protein [Planctomycetia bacterium]
MSCSRSSRFALVAGAAVTLAWGGNAREAFAIKQFFDEFKAVYVKPDSADPAEKSLAAEVDAAKCNVCHMGSSKKERNAYGNALAERLDKKEDAKNVEKIRKALEEVAALPSDPAASGSPTFGALLKQGKLPAGK